MIKVIKEWTTSVGLPGIITISHSGFYCGYVEIPKLPVPLCYTVQYIDFDELLNWTPVLIKAQTAINNILIHGGLTFLADHPAIDNRHLIGFDCAHVYDKPDIERAKIEFGESEVELLDYIFPESVLRTEAYVTNQVETLAEQMLPILDMLKE